MSRITNILALCIANIPSARVGVISSLQNLSDRNISNFKFSEFINMKKEDLYAADVVVLIRSSAEFELSLVKELKKAGKYIVYFLDDDLINVPSTSLTYAYYSDETNRNNMYSIMKLSDCLWTTNKGIASRYGSFFPKTAVLNAPAILLKENIPVNRNDEDSIVIGFCGSLDHTPFLEKLFRPVIKNIIKKHKSVVKFKFFGAKPSFVKDYSLGYIPYQADHRKYVRLLKENCFDIGLAPLPETDFHGCKYFNKYLEYGAMGASGIYSNVKPYTYIIKDGINGLLVENKSDSWLEAINLLINEREKRLAIRKKAYEDLSENFSISCTADNLLAAIPEFGSYIAPLYDEKNAGINDITPFRPTFINKLINVFKTKRLRAPGYLIKKLYYKLVN